MQAGAQPFEGGCMMSESVKNTRQDDPERHKTNVPAPAKASDPPRPPRRVGPQQPISPPPPVSPPPQQRSSSTPIGRLSQILTGGSVNFHKIWNATDAAVEFAPLPRGVYVCHATGGELVTSRTNRTPGFKIEFTVIEGDFKGRKLWSDHWLTPAALPATKRDLAKLGITSPEQMEQQLPRWIRCNVTVVVRKGDDGIEHNEVRLYEVLGIDKPEPDAFAPSDPGNVPESEGDAGTSSSPDVS